MHQNLVWLFLQIILEGPWFYVFLHSLCFWKFKSPLIVLHLYLFGILDIDGKLIFWFFLSHILKTFVDVIQLKSFASDMMTIQIIKEFVKTIFWLFKTRICKTFEVLIMESQSIILMTVSNLYFKVSYIHL